MYIMMKCFTVLPRAVNDWGVESKRLCRRRATVADDWLTGLIPPTLKGENGLVQIQCTFISQWDRSWYEFALATVLPPLCHHRRQHWQLDWSPHPLKDESRLVEIQLNGYSLFSQWGRLIAGKYEFALVDNTDNWTNSPLSRAKMDSSKFNALTFILQ